MMCEDDAIDIRDLPEYLAAPSSPPQADDEGLLPMAEVHKRHALRVLAAVHGNKAEAARILGLHRATLYRLIGELEPEEANAAGG
jgi:transcriptional regulator of acetoin/glycerol metabolism